MKKMMMILALLFAMVGSSFGFDGTFVGKIQKVEVVNQAYANFDFRFFIEGNPGWCYVNVSDRNYKAMTATILSAFQNGNKVTAHYYNTSQPGYHIEYLFVHPVN